jgi:disulfide oxidoreductase YuzD
MKISAFVDYILKDQNYYVLLKNLNITDEKTNDKIKTFIEKAKQLASKNKYIKVEDKKTAEIFNRLKQLSPANILKE